MPIIQLAASDSPLTQGDILQGVNLFETRLSESGGDSEASKAELSLVLSRPCVAAHKQSVLVAELRNQSPSLPKEVESFEDALGFFTDTRDGLDTPDRFYLGTIPAYHGRFFVMLDRIYTVTYSDIESLLKRRVATLNPEFARDLHLRIFRSFASLGFDDVGWFATDDLKLLIQYGQSELAAFEKTVSDLKLKQGQQEFRGQQFKEKDLVRAEESHRNLVEQLRPYEEELTRRSQLDEN